MAATGSYSSPPICATSSAKDLSPSSSSSLPRFTFKPSLSIASVSGTRLSDAGIKRRRRRRHRSSNSRVSCVFSNSPQAVTACQWNERVIASDELVLVEFWTSWCGPCVVVRRMVEEISEEYTERMKLYTIDAEDHPQVAAAYGVDQVPTVLLFKDGDKVESITGTLPKSVYVKAIERYLS